MQNDIQAPINRQIIRSSETIMYFIDVFEGLTKAFFSTENDNDVGTTDNKPRYADAGFGMLGQMVNFAKVIYNLSK